MRHLVSQGKSREFGYVTAASQAPNKVSARHSKINQGRPGFHPSLFHTLQIKQNSTWNILSCVTGVSRVYWEEGMGSQEEGRGYKWASDLAGLSR